MVTPPPKRRHVESSVHSKENRCISPKLIHSRPDAYGPPVKTHKGLKNAVMFENGMIVIASDGDLTIRANEAIAKLTSVERLGSPILTSLDPLAFDVEYKCIVGFTGNPNVYVAVKLPGCKSLDAIDSYIRTALFRDQSTLNIIFM